MGNQCVLTCVILCLIAIVVPATARCNCNDPKTHYDELGCKPIYEKEGDCCPKTYDCKEPMSRASSPDKCYFKGKEYKRRENIPDELVTPSCRVACFCAKEPTRDFVCAHIDCPEFLGAFPLKPNCFRQYKPKSCCSSGMACPPFENLAMCRVNGKVYYEGQRFDPENGQCMSCLCQKGFKGKFEEPFCHTIDCNTELYSIDLKKNCAPVYYTKKGCCPISWECDDGSTYQNIGRKWETSSDNKVCRFGNRMLKIGDKFDIERKYKYSPEINCECRIPPLVTCIQKPNN